jgi:hypothetical protein
MTATPLLVTGVDAAVVAGQLGRPPHAMSAVAARCPFGFPAVVEDLPYDGAGRPFPTLYYCTCPTLVAAVSRLESDGGVARWTSRLANEADLARSAVDAAADSAVRRTDLVRIHELAMVDGGASLAGGVGGVGDLLAVKCLHAHVAHALARPGYVLGDAILAEVADSWCNDRRCAAHLPDGDAGHGDALDGGGPSGGRAAPFAGAEDPS